MAGLKDIVKRCDAQFGELEQLIPTRDVATGSRKRRPTPRVKLRCYRCRCRGHIARECCQRLLAPTSKIAEVCLPRPVVSPTLPSILVNAARIGDIRALIVSSMQRSMIERSRLGHLSWHPLPSEEVLMTPYGSAIRVLGWTKLAIRFKHRIVDMSVRVVNKLALPLVLGVDWFDAAGAVAYAEGSCCKIALQDSPTRRDLCSPSHSYMRTYPALNYSRKSPRGSSHPTRQLPIRARERRIQSEDNSSIGWSRGD